MAEPKKRNRVLSFRLSDEEFAAFDEKLKASRMSKSEFFREVFINAKVSFNVKAAPPKEYGRLLFLYNKSSNNINQLTHSVHRAYRRGIVSERLYVKLLNSLVNIEALLLAGVNDADSS
ncbi:molybdopterin-guanine dinucleotide biosynthesis protein MobC [Pseudomonas protegens]|uniref:Molybdopterin-guanine dinucleotide biosynthesis protein MobC n=1 Tax=Pseudomonas protegens TaxID=380021 RepID=A0A2T6GBE0_9PSED|nr:ribbon-helix-helix protein, CopG family [Pseudomonas protegens]PUA41474.1 molybdopterin-guanine dinucleotide biosynthesis protein MobC [Pseudomonas protegens]